MLVTFEGIDGCGKTTQIKLLQDALVDLGLEPLLTKQPGGTEIGVKIRALLLDRANAAMCAETELLLYMADRMQHLSEVIKPAIGSGQLVLCDRFHDATIAYQGGGRGLDLSWLKPLEAKMITPSLTFFFHISPEVSKERIHLRGEELCRLEAEEKSFFERVNQGYLDLAQGSPNRFVVIDAEQPIATVHQAVLSKVMKLIES